MMSGFENLHPICKICSADTKYLGSLDANKCCIDRLGSRALPISPVTVPYFVCTNCGFIFTTFMDKWTPEEFKRRIYNHDYERINPPIPGRTNVPFKETPSYTKGKSIASLFDGSQNELRIIDFGAGGNPGPTGQALIDAGFHVHSHEPYRADCAEPEGRYGLIIAIEVLEHCHDLKSITGFVKKYIQDDGIVWIQTLVHPHPAPEDILTSWYIAPRDGHISIHTLWSLTLMFNSIGLNFVQTVHGMFAFRKMPEFSNKIFLNPGAFSR
jgi:Methyltransferase domain